MTEPGARPADEWSLEQLIAIFDVTPAGTEPAAFVGETGEAGSRNVVEGSQVLAQSIVAACKALPGRTVRSAHSLFVGVTRPGKPVEATVETVRAGRSFASAVVTARQDGKTSVTTTVLLDHPQPDLIRHQRTSEPEAGVDDSFASYMPVTGREIRIAGVRNVNDPDEVGEPVLDAWLRYAQLPERDDLRRALLAHFTGHLAISATFRGHAGIGTSQSHYTVLTAPMGIGITFHEPVGWDGWIRYHHESTYVGAGMSYTRGEVLTGDGRLIASFTQDAMIKGLDPDSAASQIPAESRL